MDTDDTETRIKAMLDEQLPCIVESLKKQLEQQVLWNVQENAAKQIGEAVKKWVAENVIPSVISTLVESRNGLVSLGAKLAPLMVDAMVASISDTISATLKDSWKRRDLFKKLLGEV